MNKDVAYISCIQDFIGILNLIIGENKTSLKLFSIINEKILSKVTDRSKFESIKDVFVDHIYNSKIIDAFNNVITSKILFKGNRNNKDDDSYYLHASAELVKCLASFTNNITKQTKDFKLKELNYFHLKQMLKVYISNFNKHEIKFHDIDHLIELINLWERLEIERKSPDNETNLIEIEEMRFTKIFYYLKSKDKDKQLSTVIHLNQYNFKTHAIKANLILDIIRKKPLFNALFIKDPQENFLSRLTPFFIFISPIIDFNMLSQLLQIKKKASISVSHCIKNCLSIFMQKLNLNVR